MTVKCFPDVFTGHAINRWSANVCRVGRVSCARLRFVRRIATANEAIAVVPVSVDVALVGSMIIVPSVLRTQVAKTEPATNRGSAIAVRDGVECCAMRS